ncbi:hypothetical protein Back11_53000 [Paenibacillus baekrokdamisoli]|uniref:Bacterial transcriptional activator domain-containing protein n=2 Tax=Paenibacillus baekrokdamisoli TaxID=1712516 RepID=A0A3G9J6M4_9BACL|nr:hypothetical protein Back11_53000 [Paenibacillus baekrokdamisoli]
MKSPLLLRAECENGLLDGRLLETQQLLEAALKGFAAQADEASMLAMMGMLGLLYEQVGDRQESQPLLALLWQEWSRTPEYCSGFVPWALARAIANGSLKPGELEAAGAEELFQEAAERFRQERKPLWAGFVLLDRLLFNPDRLQSNDPDWQLWLNWLNRHLGEQPYGKALCEVLMSPHPSIEAYEALPLRYSYLCKAILMDVGEETVPSSLAGDIEVQFYASSSKIKRLLDSDNIEEAAHLLEMLKRYHKRVSTPGTVRVLLMLQKNYAALTGQSSLKVETIATPMPASSADKETRQNQKEAPPSAVHAHTGFPAEKWQVKLINGIRFITANDTIVEPVWKRRKAGELLVYLLLQPNYKSNREEVVERVFGEGEPSKRSNQLYVTLHDLRHSLKELGMSEDLVYAKRGLIGIEEHHFTSVDAETYLTLSRVGDQLWMDDREAACRLYEEAMPLYGQLGKELPHADWLERVKEQLLDRQTVMLKRLAVYDMEIHNEVRAEQRLTDWISLRPDQEDAYETLIRHCLNLGRRSEAIGWYRRLEKMCLEERGIEPLEEIRLLIWK